MKSRIFFLLLLLFPVLGRAAECLGPANATSFAVYLHGLDSPEVGPQELGNRKLLAGLASRLKMRIAVPRGPRQCANGQSTCWGWNFNEETVVSDAKVVVKAAAKECFPAAQAKIGLIGFSNGGYIVNEILKRCQGDEFRWLVSIAAGEKWENYKETKLDNCGTYRLLVGTGDEWNLGAAREFIPRLQKANADFEFIEFKGGHELPATELEAVLKKLNAGSRP